MHLCEAGHHAVRKAIHRLSAVSEYDPHESLVVDEHQDENNSEVTMGHRASTSPSARIGQRPGETPDQAMDRIVAEHKRGLLRTAPFGATGGRLAASRAASPTPVVGSTALGSGPRTTSPIRTAPAGAEAALLAASRVPVLEGHLEKNTKKHYAASNNLKHGGGFWATSGWRRRSAATSERPTGHA